MDTCCGQLSASRGSPSPTSLSPCSPGWGGGTLLETQSFYAQKPQDHLSVSFFWHYFTRLQDKLDFMRPIRTQTERRFAAEPWGQLCAVLQDLWGPGIGQGSVLQWTLRKEDGGPGGKKGDKAEMPPLLRQELATNINALSFLNFKAQQIYNLFSVYKGNSPRHHHHSFPGDTSQYLPETSFPTPPPWPPPIPHAQPLPQQLEGELGTVAWDTRKAAFPSSVILRRQARPQQA